MIRFSGHQEALRLGGALALIGAVWRVLVLRRAGHHGGRFLPMVYAQRF